MKKSRDLLFIFILFGINLLFFYQVFLGKQPVPTDSLVGLYHPWRDLYAADNPNGVPFKNFLITDPVRQQIPWRKLVVDSWKNGRLPVWNTYNFIGTPLLTNIQSASFYPFNVLFFLTGFIPAWIMLVIAEPLLSSVFMYLFLRIKNLDSASSLFGAVVWSFSGFHIAWLTWGTINHVSLWLPLLLCFLELIIRDRNGKINILWCTGFILSFINAFFAGHAQIFFYVCLTVLFYIVWNFNNIKDNRSVVSSLIFSFFIIFIVTSVQWYPLINFFTVSNRIGEVNSWMKEGWFLPVAHLVQFIVPDFFGNPTTLNYWGTWNYGELVGYIGVIPLIFALCGIFFVRSKDAIFYKALVIVSVILMSRNVFSELIYKTQFPVLASFQPTRLMVVVDFALSYLSALGLNKYLKDAGVKLYHIAGFLFILFVILISYQYGKITNTTDPKIIIDYTVSRHNTIVPFSLLILFCVIAVFRKFFAGRAGYQFLFTVVVISASVADLFRFGWKFTPFSPGKYFFPESKIITYLKNQPGPFRVMSLDDRIAPPNALAYYGIESVGGYDPLYFERTGEYMAAMERNEPNIRGPFGFNRIINPKNFSSPLARNLNIKYIMSFDEVTDPGYKKIMTEGRTQLYEAVNALGIAYFPCILADQASKADVMLALYSSSDDRPAYTEKNNGSRRNYPECFRAKVSDVQITSYGMKWRATALEDTILVINHIFTPEMHIYVDNMEVTAERANYLFTSVPLTAGRHDVQLRYKL